MAVPWASLSIICLPIIFLSARDVVYINYTGRILTLRLLGGGHLKPPPCSFLHFTTKISPTTYDETLCKFLYHTCGNSYALIWSKNLIFAHFKASKGRRVQNRDFCTCQFRVLRGIFWGLFMNQKLFRIKKY